MQRKMNSFTALKMHMDKGLTDIEAIIEESARKNITHFTASRINRAKTTLQDVTDFIGEESGAGFKTRSISKLFDIIESEDWRTLVKAVNDGTIKEAKRELVTCQTQLQHLKEEQGPDGRPKTNRTQSVIQPKKAETVIYLKKTNKPPSRADSQVITGSDTPRVKQNQTQTEPEKYQLIKVIDNRPENTEVLPPEPLKDKKEEIIEEENDKLPKENARIYDLEQKIEILQSEIQNLTERSYHAEKAGEAKENQRVKELEQLVNDQKQQIETLANTAKELQDKLVAVEAENTKGSFDDVNLNLSLIEEETSTPTEQGSTQDDGKIYTKAQRDRKEFDFERDLKRKFSFREPMTDRTERTNRTFTKTEHSKRESGTFLSLSDFGVVSKPRSLLELFWGLHTKEWKKAFDDLVRSAKDEEKVIAKLLKVVKHAHHFCLTTSDNQLDTLKKVIKDELFCPNITTDMVEFLPDRQMVDIFHEADPAIVEMRKKCAVVSVPWLKRIFLKQVNDDLGIYVETNSPLHQFTDRCVEIAWLMCLQDPPMFMETCRPGDVKSDKYKSYTRSGRVIQYCVWPCVLQYRDGPLMMKGVAQMR
ncbi:hypothetical protein ACJMK2_031221 [Sinanodonta woodiana]|uniref:Mitochondria-eating protein C-terminal domain-containing protein n=1 Tax=Sinanodonta woodiana TaxID=1069815 RepID=A0ABD3X233_SINWO